MKRVYGEFILRSLRMYEDLEPDDNSKDLEFNELSPREVLDKLLNYEGIVGYTQTIIDIINDVYNVELD